MEIIERKAAVNELWRAEGSNGYADGHVKREREGRKKFGICLSFPGVVLPDPFAPLNAEKNETKEATGVCSLDYTLPVHIVPRAAPSTLSLEVKAYSSLFWQWGGCRSPGVSGREGMR